MTYRVVDAKDVEPWRGAMRRIRRALGVESFGLNQLELPPNEDRYPEHDETEHNHDEVYICVTGRGEIVVDGERIELRPGRYVYVSPESRRKVVSGDLGLRCVVVGAPANRTRDGWENL